MALLTAWAVVRLLITLQNPVICIPFLVPKRPPDAEAILHQTVTHLLSSLKPVIMTINDNVSNPAGVIQSFRDPEKNPNPFKDNAKCAHRTRILIFGATGVGKSSLIAAVSGQTLAVSHELKSG